MDATDAEQQFISLIDAAIARVAHQARDDRDCALLLAELEAIRQRVLDSRVRYREAASWTNLDDSLSTEGQR